MSESNMHGLTTNQKLDENGVQICGDQELHGERPPLIDANLTRQAEMSLQEHDEVETNRNLLGHPKRLVELLDVLELVAMMRTGSRERNASKQ